MIYLVHGDDRDAVLKKSKEILLGAKQKRAQAELFRFEDSNWDANAFEGMVGGAGLFETKYIVECVGLLDRTDAREFLAERFADLASADHLFLFVEGKVDKKTLEKITPHVMKVYPYIIPEMKKKPEFNSFALSDAFAEKRTGEAWILLSDAFSRGVSPEEIAGSLFWKIKTIALVKRGLSASELGMKEFPYKKAKESASRFTLPELMDMSSRLVFSYHRAHEGKCDLSRELEKIVLG